MFCSLVNKYMEHLNNVILLIAKGKGSRMRERIGERMIVPTAAVFGQELYQFLSGIITMLPQRLEKFRNDRRSFISRSFSNIERL